MRIAICILLAAVTAATAAISPLRIPGVMLPDATAAASGNDLLNGLIAHWRFDEASGDRVDAHSTNDLPQFNTITNTSSAIITNAADLVKANSEYLFIDASGHDWAFSTNQAFTVSFWIYWDDTTSFTSPVDYGTSTATLNFRWRVNSSQFQLMVKDSTGSQQTLDGPSGISTATWYYVVLWHDPDEDEIGMRVDSTDYSQAHTDGTDGHSGTQGIRFGYLQNTAYFDGRFDSASFWDRVLTSAERDLIYNAGSGLDYDQFELE